MMDINTQPQTLCTVTQFFSLNHFLSCIIKLSSENTEVCLVCTLLPLILLLFFFLSSMAVQPMAVLSLHKGLLPVSCLWPVFPDFNFAFNNVCSVGTRQSVFYHIYFIITTRSHLCCFSSGNVCFKIEVLHYIYCRIIVDNFLFFFFCFVYRWYSRQLNFVIKIFLTVLCRTFFFV